MVGKYVRKDLNMPLSLPRRQGAPDSFYKDCPLTQVGETQALLLGKALCTAEVSLQHVYCSPSLRSLQTCRGILRGLLQDETTPIALEPGLFEWLAWYTDAMPQFMTPKEMTEAGFRLKDDHQYFVDFSELTDRRESAEQYYMRSHYIVQSVLRTTQHIGTYPKLKQTSPHCTIDPKKLVVTDKRLYSLYNNSFKVTFIRVIAESEYLPCFKFCIM